MTTFAVIALVALLVPYFGWGVYALQLRYIRHHDWPIQVEAASLGGLIVFYALALPVLRTYLSETPAAFMFAMLGLLASGFALYGHMAISLTAKLVVDTITHSPDSAPNVPRLGPAEALERQRDYDGAYNEYLVLARIYPHDAAVKMRLADVCLHLKRAPEAADWFERVMQRKPTRDTYSMAAARLAELAAKELNDLPRARRAVQSYLDAHPTAPDCEAMKMRLEGMGTKRTEKRISQLERLDHTAKVAPDVHIEAEEKSVSAPLPGIEAIDTPMVVVVREKEVPAARVEISSFSLERLDLEPMPKKPAPAPEPRAALEVPIELDKLDEAPRE